MTQSTQSILSGPLVSRPWQDAMKRLAPESYARLMKFYAASQRPGHLSPKLRHLLWVAVDAVPTHLYPPGIELHARLALDHGASLAEVVEALEIASTTCERGLGFALPLVLDEARAAGAVVPKLAPALTAQQQAVKDAFIARDGIWPENLDLALQLLPEYLAAQLQMNRPVAAAAGLEAKWRELIFLAVYSCPATLDEAAVRRHAQGCLRLGASTGEMIEAVQCASGIGIHAFSLGMPALSAAVDAANSGK